MRVKNEELRTKNSIALAFNGKKRADAPLSEKRKTKSEKSYSQGCLREKRKTKSEKSYSQGCLREKRKTKIL